MAKQKENSEIVKYLIVIIIVIGLLNISLYFLSKINLEPISKKTQSNINSLIKSGNATTIALKIPAVDSEGNGVSTILTVEAKKGTGRTTVDIENLLFWADTQQSIRMARFVAQNISGIDASKYDLNYNVKADNASVIGGPSAGAALVLATIFSLEGLEPRNDVMITGTINHDGSLGPVGGILEKAKAAKQAGATIFIVPLLQSRDIVYESKQHCQKFGFTEVCTTETIPKRINVESEAGIKIIEISNIEEALKYFEKNQSVIS